MDRFHGGRTIFSNIDDEKKAVYESPANASVLNTYHSNQLFVNMDQSVSEARVAAPPSPESPWLKSPLRSPSSSLVYRCVASLHRLDGHIYSVGIAKGVVFTSSESRRIRVWSKYECGERGYIKVKPGQIRSILVRGPTVFTAHKDYKIRMWRFYSSQPDRFHAEKILTIPKRNPLFPFLLSSSEQSARKDCISCMAYYNMEGLLYTGSWDKTIRVWNIRERICQDVIAAHEDKINSILINQEDGTIFSCSSDASIKIWRRVCGEKFHTLIMTLRYQHCPVNALASSSAIDKQSSVLLYSGSSDGLISFWVKEKNSTRFSHGGLLQGHSLNILCLAAIGNVVFSGSEDTTIRVWKRGGGPGWIHECLAVLEGHRGPVKCLAACLDMEKVAKGFVLYSGGLDQSLKVWRIKVSPDDTGKPDEQPHRASVDVPLCKKGPVLSPAWVELKLRGEI